MGVRVGPRGEAAPIPVVPARGITAGDVGRRALDLLAFLVFTAAPAIGSFTLLRYGNGYWHVMCIALPVAMISHRCMDEGSNLNKRRVLGLAVGLLVLASTAIALRALGRPITQGQLNFGWIALAGGLVYCCRYCAVHGLQPQAGRRAAPGSAALAAPQLSAAQQREMATAYQSAYQLLLNTCWEQRVALPIREELVATLTDPFCRVLIAQLEERHGDANLSEMGLAQFVPAYRFLREAAIDDLQGQLRRRALDPQDAVDPEVAIFVDQMRDVVAESLRSDTVLAVMETGLSAPENYWRQALLPLMFSGFKALQNIPGNGLEQPAIELFTNLERCHAWRALIENTRMVLDTECLTRVVLFQAAVEVHRTNAPIGSAVNEIRAIQTAYIAARIHPQDQILSQVIDPNRPVPEALRAEVGPLTHALDAMTITWLRSPSGFRSLSPAMYGRALTGAEEAFQATHPDWHTDPVLATALGYQPPARDVVPAPLAEEAPATVAAAT